MRKILIASLLGALAASGSMLMPGAHANGDCGTGPDPGQLGSTSGTLRFGVGGVGCITGHGSATGLNGYVVVDGNNANPSPLGGYIGVRRHAGDGSVDIVGCSRGDFDEFNEGEGHTGNQTIDPTNPAPTAACPVP